MFQAHRFALKTLAAALLAAYNAIAHASASFTVRDIRVEGLERIEASTVFAYLPLRPGEIFNEDKATEVIRTLYATGFFNDVRVAAQGDLVVVQVLERPMITSVDLSGIRAVDKNKLNENLQALGLTPGHYYDKNIVSKAEQRLKEEYLTLGYYGAEVTTTVTPIDRNRVALLFSAIEGERARIRQVNFIGNKAVKTRTLKGEMRLSTPDWFSWYTRNDAYGQEKFAVDLGNIRAYYLNRGYLEFNIESAQVSLSPDKKDAYLNISLHEGEPYTVSSILLTGELLDKKRELQKLLTLKPGERYSESKLRASAQAIKDKLAEYGFAFATVSEQPAMDPKQHTVALTLNIAPGQRVAVRRVNIAGNRQTRDEVIRREMRQFEGAWFDGQRLALSKARLERLDYFNGVNIDYAPVAGVDDQVDINVNVSEKRLGFVNLYAGFSSTEKLMLGGSLSQNNIFGSGTDLSLKVDTSRAARAFSIVHLNPYFTPDGVEQLTSAYYDTQKPLVSAGAGAEDFTINRIGGRLRFGIPFSEVDKVYFGLGFEQNRFKAYEQAPKRYQEYIQEFGRVVNSAPLTIGWARDARDHPTVPSRGTLTRANFELGLPIASTKYYKIDLQQQYYYSFARGFVLGLNGELGYGRGLSGKPFPIFKNYYAGGIGSVRGYEPASLGPKDEDAQVAIGGAKSALVNAEISVPLPKTGFDRMLRVFAFVDAGNVWDEKQTPRLSDIRYSYGLGLTWISPIGPLKFSWGFPIVKKAGDAYRRFEFTIGTSF
ncbi:Outer membrane protein, OMP85 family [Candidatus Glomeribacter gigasporarum BEG34]|uniref:Outer membrane protein assembly factor BamA n=1 Tax=Candidatus Glomeribacter gigasporarum BEG34 TaxID=1070319 RepID=G2J9U9_9BURK|nr:outer membrane protein assembly factor BamA [Candidatus Glomeribacter gigasporarum]CCD29546.1 Outer membrane protein, OMP85 family [Candidatus Glomeribacter gigasporarum BEG34]